MNTTHIDPCLDGIRPHACIKHIPQWPDNGPQMISLRAAIQSTGIVSPVLITAKHEIVCSDSRERWRAAKALQLDKIPVLIVPDDQVVTYSLNALARRRHLTKSAIAYLAFPMLKSALDEAQERAKEMLRKGCISPSSIPCRTAKSVEDIAVSLDISETLVREARRVHEIFTKDPVFKAQMEPRILAEPVGGEHDQHRPVGLGAVIAGHAGKKNEDKARIDHSQLELFGQAIKSFCIRAPLPAHESQARKVIAAQLEKLTPEELENVQRAASLVVSEARAIKTTKP